MKTKKALAQTPYKSILEFCQEPVRIIKTIRAEGMVLQDDNQQPLVIMLPVRVWMLLMYTKLSNERYFAILSGGSQSISDEELQKQIHERRVGSGKLEN